MIGDRAARLPTKNVFSLATSINQGEQRTRERAKNESHEWSRWRTHGVENEGEERESEERERDREKERETEKHREYQGRKEVKSGTKRNW